MGIYGNDPEAARRVMKLEYQGNNVLAVLLDKELPLEEKVRALGKIQREMNEQEKDDLTYLWRKMSHDTGRDLPIPKPGFHTTIYDALKGAFDRATGCPTEWDIEQGTNPKYEPDLTLSLYIGEILVTYKQKYPEYCQIER